MINRIDKTGAKLVKLPKPCTYCKGLGHLAFGCTKKPRKPLRVKKPMKKIGHIGQQLIDQRKAYLEAYPAPHYCFYCAYVGIDEALPERHIQLEHFLTKNNHPELRFDWSNIVKSCPGHNELKNGTDGPEFLKQLDQIRRI